MGFVRLPSEPVATSSVDGDHKEKQAIELRPSATATLMRASQPIAPVKKWRRAVGKKISRSNVHREGTRRRHGRTFDARDAVDDVIAIVRDRPITLVFRVAPLEPVVNHVTLFARIVGRP
jgi:hypothetical protein